MLTTRGEILVALGKSASITDADLSLLDMIHPLAESALQTWMSQNLIRPATAVSEYYPIGQPMADQGLLDNLERSPSSERAVFYGGRPNAQRTEILQLKHTPVITTGLVVKEDPSGFAGQADGSFGSGTTLELGVDYWLDIDDATNGVSRSGILYREGGWPTEPRSIKVTYFGGWTVAQLASGIAGAIRLAAIKTVVANYKYFELLHGKTVGPISSRSIGKYSESRDVQIAAAVSGFICSVPPTAQQDLQPFRNYGRLFA